MTISDELSPTWIEEREKKQRRTWSDILRCEKYIHILLKRKKWNQQKKSIEHDDLNKMRDLNKTKKDSNAIIENNLYSSELCNAYHKMNNTNQIMSETTWAINISPHSQVELSILDEISKEPWGKLNWSRRSFETNRTALGLSLCLNLSDHFYF
jgi:hypothetical protein